MTIWRRALDLLWPRNCEICGRPVDREARYICAECLNRIPFVRPEDGMYEIDDAASAVRDEYGQLREDYCLDLATRGSRLNDAGCEAVVDFIRENYPL